MEAADAQSDFFELREIDITDWNSSVAGQYNIRSIPHCMIYGRDGQLKESGPDVCWAIVENPSALLRY